MQHTQRHNQHGSFPSMLISVPSPEDASHDLPEEVGREKVARVVSNIANGDLQSHEDMESRHLGSRNGSTTAALERGSRKRYSGQQWRECRIARFQCETLFRDRRPLRGDGKWGNAQSNCDEKGEVVLQVE